MIMNNDLDLKAYYRFVEFVLKMDGGTLPHERYKLISLDKYPCESLEELKVKRVSNAFMYLMNNINQILNKEIIKDCYYLLTNEIISDEIVLKILEEYYKNKNENIHYLAALIHFAVLDNVLVDNVIFAFMLSNLIAVKNGGTCYIPFQYIKDKYIEAITEKSINKMIYVFASIEAKEKKVFYQTTKENIIDTIWNKREELTTKFKIDRIYLYGSYAKDKITEFSDIDLLVVFKNDVNVFEKTLIRKNVKEYLTSLFNINVDIIDFNIALTTLDIKEMDNLITII